MRGYAFFLFVFCMGFGLWLNDHSWNGQLFVYVGEERAPAAVRSLREYSSLDHEALYRSTQAQLMAYAELIRDEGYLGLRLGHPLMTGAGGGKEFGCQVQDHSGVYDRLEVTFVATGISENGELPHMTVDARCHSDSDLNRLDTIWIPLAQILQNPVRDGDIDLGGENMSRLYFEHMPDSWPENWVIWSVRLYREDGGATPLQFDARQLRAAETKLMSFDWKAGQ
jgi:hypothetical protein